MIADSYFILGGHHADEAVILVRKCNEGGECARDAGGRVVPPANELRSRPQTALPRRPARARREVHETSDFRERLLPLPSSASSPPKPTLNKSTVHSVLMSLNTDEYFAFVQDCPDPCWFI
ncbi:N-acylethanolamine-hydrolyzing acid amidase [Aphelenchoides fujianensis]|nr:N-acylethanolamine-hydrolyzing acid amidase [Aphelenchoides fujianensis]